MERFHTQEWFTYAIAPPRAMYLVRKGNQSDVRTAIREASSRWGGITEPIIPVAGDGDIHHEFRPLVDLLCPDVVVGVDADTGASIGRGLGLSYIPIVHINAAIGVSASAHPAIFSRATGSQSDALVSASGRHLWEAAGAGYVEYDDLQPWADCGASLYHARTGDEIGRAQLSSTTAIAHTSAGLRAVPASGQATFSPAVVYVTDGSPMDVLHFWNTRALRVALPSVSTSMAILPSSIDSWTDFGRYFRSTLRLGELTVPDVLLFGTRVSRASLEEVARALGLERLKSDTLSVRWGRTSWPDSPPPYTYDILSPAGLVAVPRWYGMLGSGIARASHTSCEVDVALPITPRGGGYTRLRLGGLVAFDTPQRDAVASRFLPNARFRAGNLEVTTRVTENVRLQLTLPSAEEVLAAVLSESHVKAALSDKGRYTNAVLSTFGWEPFADVDLLRAISALTTPRSKELLKQLGRVANSGDADSLRNVALEWAPRRQQQFLSAELVAGRCGVPLAEAIGVVERLSDLTIAERGLAMVCANCGLHSFIPLTQGITSSECPGCRSSQPFKGGREGLLLHYRLNSLMDQASDNGALSHAFAVSLLSRSATQSYFLPGANVGIGLERMPNANDPEIDILGYVGSLFVVGEAKMSSAEFTEGQISRDIDLSLKLAADAYVMASLDEISSSVRKRARDQTATRGLRLITVDPKSQVVIE